MKMRNMKKIKTICILLVTVLIGSSCNNWLDILPENQQSSDEYWKTKEEVASVVGAGYSYLRKLASDATLFKLGELRAGRVYLTKGDAMQSFQMTPSYSGASWAGFYKVINMANSVLANAPGVLEKDPTFNEAVMKSYLVEAYFQRALSYFYLVRNWRDVPLILTPYTTDEYSFNIKQSPEEEVVQQIKDDIKTALATGAAKATYPNDFDTKGRATKWALYALMADVCLWSGDYAGAIEYSNNILENTTDAFCPTFMSENSQTSWFTIYNPGNSNESIFEIQYSDSKKQTNNFANTYFGNSNPTYEYTPQMLKDFTKELTQTEETQQQPVRTLYGGYLPDNIENYLKATKGYIWKYTGKEAGNSSKRAKDQYDSHFILYRVPEVMLIKAEALVMQGASGYDQALELVNKIRIRSNLEAYPSPGSIYSERQLLYYIMYEGQMELAAEGKIWYTLLRMGRRSSTYKQYFLIEQVSEYNTSANSAWIRTVLKDDNALFLPVATSEKNNNPLLVQNPYYE